MRIRLKSINVNDSVLKGKITKLRNTLERDGRSTTKQAAQMLQLKAQLAAPHETNDLRRYIKVIPVVTKTDKSYLVGFSNRGFGEGNPHPNKIWKEGEFSLPKWMEPNRKTANTQAASHPWKTGSRSFLYDATEDIRKVFKKDIVRMTRNSIIKTRLK